jgi:hypothetical protein
VFATVTKLGSTMRRTQLSPRTIADVVTVGDYVYLPNEGWFRIKIESTLSDAGEKVDAVYKHLHKMERG